MTTCQTAFCSGKFSLNTVRRYVCQHVSQSNKLSLREEGVHPVSLLGSFLFNCTSQKITAHFERWVCPHTPYLSPLRLPWQIPSWEDGTAYKQQINFSQFQMLGRPRSRHQDGGILLKALFLVPSQHLTEWPLHPHRVNRPRELGGGGSLLRSLIPFLRAPPSRLRHLPKAPLLNSSRQALGLQHMNWVGGREGMGAKNIQTIIPLTQL